MKKKYHDIDPKNRGKMLTDFYSMVSKIKDKSDAKKFFKDLLTPGETIMIIHRIEVAKMLIQGFSYKDIQKK